MDIKTATQEEIYNWSMMIAPDAMNELLAKGIGIEDIYRHNLALDVKMELPEHRLIYS